MPTPAEPAQAIKLFYSYAPSDEPLRLELEKHLSILRRSGHLFDWHSRQILPGSEWAEETKQHLHAAQIILLLISADFLASEEQYDIEMQRAIEQHSRGEARVIPIILRDVDWKADRFLQKLKVLPADEKPVTSWPLPPTHDEAFADIARGIRSVVEEYQKKPLLASSPATQGAQVWNVPSRRNPFFTGREKLLTALHNQLNRTKTLAFTRAQAVSGLGGIGKTQTAVEYAYRYRPEYRAILWVNATTQQTLIADYVMNPRIQCGGLQQPEKVLQARNMTSLSLARDYVTGEIGTSGCEASPDLYGSRLNMARGLTKCLLRQTA